MIAPVLIAALLATPAQAYKLLGYMWSVEDLPLEWYMADHEEDSLSNAPSYGYDSVMDYQVHMMQRAYSNWYAAECAEINDVYMGSAGPNTGKANDGMNAVYWDDPQDAYPSGALAVAAYSITNEFLRSQEGTNLYRFADVDIIFNDNVDWALTEEAEEYCGGGMVPVEPVATHEVGHLWGLGHSCDDGEPCNDEALRYATMYWQYTSCSLAANDVNSDDMEAINALYGPYATFSTSSNRFGGLPLDVDFELSTGADVNITGVEWDFGDGNKSNETNPTHTYTDQGQYTVLLTIAGNSEACGDWDYTYRRRAYIIACGEPEPGLSPEGTDYPGLFTYEHQDGLRFQMVNRTDTSVYGCLDTVIWEVYDDKGSLEQQISAWSPLIEFPSGGEWTVVLNVGGPGGMGAAELTIDTAGEGGGCSHVAIPAGLLSLFGGLGLAVTRRRRNSPR